MKSNTTIFSIFKKNRQIMKLFLIVFIFVAGYIVYNYSCRMISQEPFNLQEPFNMQEQFKGQLFFVNLVLYSHSPEYDQMYEITRKYYSKFSNVKTIYYRFNPNISQEYELIADVLNIKGQESYVPGILDKTVKALDYINKNFTFDYLVRSNISTIIRFDALSDELVKNPIQYGAGVKMILNALDPPAGIVDNTYIGTIYGSGTAIIFSKDTVDKFLSKKESIHYNIIDDVAIGLLFDEQLKCIKKGFVDSQYFFMVPDVNGDPDKLNALIANKPYIFYRNRQTNRQIDIAQMKVIVDYLSKK